MLCPTKQSRNSMGMRDGLKRAVSAKRVLIVRSQKKFVEGATVKVVSSVKIFHAPKHPEGLDLQGLTGTINKNVSQFQGKELSATLPYKVDFKTEKDGAPVKFSAHLGEDELEVVQ